MCAKPRGSSPIRKSAELLLTYAVYSPYFGPIRIRVPSDRSTVVGLNGDE